MTIAPDQTSSSRRGSQAIVDRTVGLSTLGLLSLGLATWLGARLSWPSWIAEPHPIVFELPVLAIVIVLLYDARNALIAERRAESWHGDLTTSGGLVVACLSVQFAIVEGGPVGSALADAIGIGVVGCLILAVGRRGPRLVESPRARVFLEASETHRLVRKALGSGQAVLLGLALGAGLLWRLLSGSNTEACRVASAVLLAGSPRGLLLALEVPWRVARVQAHRLKVRSRDASAWERLDWADVLVLDATSGPLHIPDVPALRIRSALKATGKSLDAIGCDSESGDALTSLGCVWGSGPNPIWTVTTPDDVLATLDQIRNANGRIRKRLAILSESGTSQTLGLSGKMSWNQSDIVLTLAHDPKAFSASTTSAPETRLPNDLVIPSDRPSVLADVMRLARSTSTAIHRNLFWALVLLTTGVPVAILQLAGPGTPALAAITASIGVAAVTIRQRRPQ